MNNLVGAEGKAAGAAAAVVRMAGTNRRLGHPCQMRLDSEPNLKKNN
jgi:hypothetical protein